MLEMKAEKTTKKPVTVMDVVDDEEDFGPAPPPSTSESELLFPNWVHSFSLSPFSS